MSAEYEAACEIREALNDVRDEIEALLPAPRVQLAAVMLHAWIVARKNLPTQSDIEGALAIADTLIRTSQRLGASDTMEELPTG